MLFCLLLHNLSHTIFAEVGVAGRGRGTWTAVFSFVLRGDGLFLSAILEISLDDDLTETLFIHPPILFYMF